ncbi:hypothetical protein [Kribbella deserti]|uniref:Secreted protein n=1 Tax=Kribbella deserti TaxID=1926257 RepID=A0ABV6QQ26_9ACTN
MKRSLLLLAAVLALVWLPAGSAQAHGVSPTADLQIAQTFAGNELTVILRRTPEVPGPLHVEVIAHDPVNPLQLGLAVAGGSSPVRLDLVAAGPHRATLRVESPGQYELVLTAGDEQAVLPFRVLVDNLASWEVVTYGGFTLAGLLILGSLGTAVLGVRRPLVRVLAVPQAVGVVVVLVVASTTAVLSKDLPPAIPDGAPPTATSGTDPADGSAPNGRPYVNLGLATVPARPSAGKPFDLQLRLYDGNTGRAVDDVVAHHAALLHAVVTSQTGNDFRHAHPVRTSPGVYTLRMAAYEPGRYYLHAEFERTDSGAQLVSADFEVGGSPVARPVERQAGNVRIDVGAAIAGRPVTVEAEVTGANDLQPWLGMAGHLVLRDQSGTFFGHAHELTSMAAQAKTVRAAAPDETVATLGPALRFTYTFPRPGRYLAWLQYARNYRIHTVPFVITVAKGERP